VRDDKRGAIPEDLPPNLERLGIAPAASMRLATEFESSFCAWVGQPERVHQACHRLGYQRARGIGACRQLFPPS
jgi:glucan biosynthesis protein